MADQGLKRTKIAALACAVALVGCGGSTAGGAQTAHLGQAAGAPARPYPESPEDWGTYHSRRYRMTIPLPTPRAWEIDDHTHAELVATEAGTRSTLVVLSEDEATLVNHDMCEARARALGLVPAAPLSTVEDIVTVGPEAYDTRIRVAIETVGGGTLVGHVLAFGAYVKKCLVVHLATVVGSEEDEQALSQRLALARVRTVGGIRVDAPGSIPRVKETPP